MDQTGPQAVLAAIAGMIEEEVETGEKGADTVAAAEDNRQQQYYIQELTNLK